ncbi:MAG: hypothetical protein ACPGGE_07715, partial [Poseidonia sp.]
YDPYNPNSVPPDADQDTIPDVLDPDNDNDGWPDDVELDRGSDIFDEQSTPFTMYFGVNTGIFYTGGLGAGSFSFEYDTDYVEISLSFVAEIVFEELVIPLLLVPIYVALFVARRNEFRRLLGEVETAESCDVLRKIETEVNEAVKERNIKVYHGLVLRNAIEVAEGDLSGANSEQE